MKIMPKRMCEIVGALVLACWLAYGGSAFAFGPTHADPEKNPAGCSACHAGKGTPGTAMLKKKPDAMCLTCHSDSGSGRAQGAVNIRIMLEKFSIHPVLETGQYHKFGEDLPEHDDDVQRHVSCGDCHSVHASDEENPIKGARGHQPKRNRYQRSSKMVLHKSEAYMICYKCHIGNASAPVGSTDKAEEFNPSNASYHPVEASARGKFSPSLRKDVDLNHGSMISCLDCHGNSDASGPRGPHGSDEKPLLIAQYRQSDGPESPNAYELCYRCHNRQSILSDESFKRHRLHVVEKEASCFACHDAHGSQSEPSLILFNYPAVGVSNTSGGPTYVDRGGGAAKCYLKCHNIDHNNAKVGEKPWPW